MRTVFHHRHAYMTKPPGGAVANHGIPDGLRNDEAKSRASSRDGVLTSVDVHMHDNGARARPASALDGPPKLPRGRELVLGWKHELSGELSATLLATSCDDSAASAGAHAGAEAVLTSTTTVVRLEGTLTLCHD